MTRLITAGRGCKIDKESAHFYVVLKNQAIAPIKRGGQGLCEHAHKPVALRNAMLSNTTVTTLRSSREGEKAWRLIYTGPNVF